MGYFGSQATTNPLKTKQGTVDTKGKRKVCLAFGRLSGRLTEVQLPRSRGMERKMKHLGNHTVILSPCQEWIPLHGNFDS